MNPTLALYIHWPFCLSKCPYCDFNSHVREGVDEARFVRALRAEMAFEAGRAGGRRLASVFFGGGTPSLLSPASVAALIGDAKRHFEVEGAVEITLEANPTSIEAGKFRDYAAAGVNRVSIGVQSLDDTALRFLGRGHDAGQARAALELARGIFPRLSFDLIYARPGQGIASWRAELRAALALAADHLSLYQLTIEEGTRFATEYARGAFSLPEGEQAAALYDATAEEAARFGLAAYEISNYARPGAQSRHNLAYWRYEDYAGIGPGAHGRLTIGPLAKGGRKLATRRHRAPEIWAGLVERQAVGSAEEVEITPEERAREALLMGLRLAEGIDRAAFLARTGLPLDDAVAPGMRDAAIEAGYLTRSPERLSATPEGRKRLDSLLAALAK